MPPVFDHKSCLIPGGAHAVTVPAAAPEKGGEKHAEDESDEKDHQEKVRGLHQCEISHSGFYETLAA